MLSQTNSYGHQRKSLQYSVRGEVCVRAWAGREVNLIVLRLVLLSFDLPSATKVCSGYTCNTHKEFIGRYFIRELRQETALNHETINKNDSDVPQCDRGVFLELQQERLYLFLFWKKQQHQQNNKKMSLIKNLWQGYTFTRKDWVQTASVARDRENGGASLTCFNSCPIFFMQGLLHCK